MKENITIKEIAEKVGNASTDFEETNTELKRKYLVWNIEAFNIIGSAVSVGKGTFGTGYPFYALDKNLEGTLPIIQEQIRYNRQLIEDAIPVQKLVWLCEDCIKKKYATMPDLKKICKPCPNVNNKVKPRKIINRMPDLDMWLVCQDGCVEIAQEELIHLLKKFNMRTSDENPLLTIDEMSQISEMLKKGQIPKIYLPMDIHIIQESILKELIENVPEVLHKTKQEGTIPYLPIHPKSYRKQWQYDDEAYNFIYDYLSAFTSFNFNEELQQSLDKTRLEVVDSYTPNELFDFLMKAATESNRRRFKSKDLEDYFFKRVDGWNLDLKEKYKQGNSNDESER